MHKGCRSAPTPARRPARAVQTHRTQQCKTVEGVFYFISKMTVRVFAWVLVRQ